MANKKISEMTAATSLTGVELIPIVQAGVNKSVTPIILLGSFLTTKVVLTHNATANITIGVKATDGVIVLDYYAVRGALYQTGRITVLNRVATAEVFHVWNGDDTGIDNVGTPITADFSGLNIRLNIVVDDISVNDVTFSYNYTTVKL